MGLVFKGLDEPEWKCLCTITQHYGAVHQKGKAMEELMELLNVIKEDLQGTFKDKKAELRESIKTKYIDEITDVLIMIRQIMLFVGISEESIRERMTYKLHRQVERIEKGTDLKEQRKPPKKPGTAGKPKPKKQQQPSAYSFADLMRDQNAEEQRKQKLDKRNRKKHK